MRGSQEGFVYAVGNGDFGGQDCTIGRAKGGIDVGARAVLRSFQSLSGESIADLVKPLSYLFLHALLP